MYKKYSDSTLLSLPKKELLLHLRAAEHNRDIAEQRIEQQAENLKDWLPVAHGHWISHEDNYVGDYYTCSVCGCDWTTIDGTPEENNMKYCPECGAKMDEEVNNGD